MDAKKAWEKADGFRKAIENSAGNNVSATASFGVSAIEFKAEDPQNMIDQADQALYAAKNTGRNRVVRWDEIASDIESHTEDIKVEQSEDELLDNTEDAPIPFHAVKALLAALGHRDLETAEHSKRVADLCVATANGLMSTCDCFVLEIAALLHDIGKIGIPDSILLKTDSLTEEEWLVMRHHDRIGIEIVNAAFSSEDLTDIIRYSHAYFAGNERELGLPTGHAIPLRSRILMIVDAYDSMVSTHTYRKAMEQHEAFDELRRCANSQFDPKLIEIFIKSVTARDGSGSVESAASKKEVALSVGLEVERLTHALNIQDMTAFVAMADRLAATATKLELPRIAKIAEELNEAVDVELNLDKTVEMMNELHDLCKTIQNNSLHDSPQN